jgi:hypothetical protein
LANNYDIGDSITITAAFATAGGVAADPTEVTVKVQDGAGTETTYLYSLAQVTKNSVGNYSLNVTLTVAGRWWYRVAGTGAVIGAAENWFYVRNTEF